MLVRLGTEDDIEAAAQVYAASSGARRGEIIPEEHIEVVRQRMQFPDSILVVAEDDGRCIGMGVAFQSRTDIGRGDIEPGICYISSIYILPDRWGERIGEHVTRAVLAEAERQGYEFARLFAYAENPRSHRLYERIGFERTGLVDTNNLGDEIWQYQIALR